MKKELLLSIIAASCLLGITACSGNTADTSKTEAAAKPASAQTSTQQTAEETVTLTVWSRDTEDSVVGRAFESDVAAFEAEHPNVKIESLHINHADVVPKWNTAFAGGVAPDVLDVGVSHIVGRVELGHLMPLDNYINTWEDKDNIIPGMIEYGNYQNKTYAIAYNASPSIFAWRKDYFEAAGLDPDTPPKDWAQFLEYCERLTEKNGDTVLRGGVELPDTRGANILWQFFLQNNAETIDYENNLPDFNKPEVIEAAQFLYDIAPYAMLNNANSAGAFLSGNAAMTLAISPDQIHSMLEEDPSLEGKIGYAPSLTNKSGGIHCGAWLYAISSQTKQPDLAWEWIRFVFSEERCRVRMEEFGIVPPVQSLNEEYIKDDPDIKSAQLKNLNQSQAYPKLNWTNVYEETLHQAYDQILYHQKTPDTAIADLQNDILNRISK